MHFSGHKRLYILRSQSQYRGICTGCQRISGQLPLQTVDSALLFSLIDGKIKYIICAGGRQRKCAESAEMNMRSFIRFRAGVPEGIRTSDPALRRRVLYPAELPGHTVLQDSFFGSPEKFFSILSYYVLTVKSGNRSGRSAAQNVAFQVTTCAACAAILTVSQNGAFFRRQNRGPDRRKICTEQ